MVMSAVRSLYSESESECRVVQRALRVLICIRRQLKRPSRVKGAPLENEGEGSRGELEREMRQTRHGPARLLLEDFGEIWEKRAT